MGCSSHAVHSPDEQALVAAARCHDVAIVRRERDRGDVRERPRAQAGARRGRLGEGGGADRGHRVSEYPEVMMYIILV